MVNSQIKAQCMQTLSALQEHILDRVKNPQHSTPLCKSNQSRIAGQPGIYIILDKGTPIYIGETGNLNKRFGDIFRTLNHSFRRHLGHTLFKNRDGFQPATSRRKFSPHLEQALDDHYASNLAVVAFSLTIGRKELEEWLVERFWDTLLNQRGQRKT